MQEDWFFYLLTLFTFAAIFGLCFIRHKYTFFERNKIVCASYPKFPFGNIYDVVFETTAMSMQLWKYHKRFGKKKCKFGGFYLFLRPGVLVVEPGILKNNREQLNILENRRDFGEELLSEILENFGNWPSLATIAGNFITEEVNFTNLANLYVAEIAESVFLSVKNPRLVEGITREGSFSKFLGLVGINFPFISQKPNQKYRRLIEGVFEDRKKGVRKNDVVQTLQDNNHSIGENVDVIFRLIQNLQVSLDLLSFTIFELSLNREIQDDLRGEILRYRKDQPINTFRDLPKLTYLDSVICETLRKYPETPFTSHTCVKNFDHDGVKFPENLLLFCSIFGLHHDGLNYTNPELFDPDRFSEENRKFVDGDKYMPFGFGGGFDSKFITSIMKMILMELVAKFKFSLGKKTSRIVKFDERFLKLKPKENMWFKFENVESNK